MEFTTFIRKPFNIKAVEITVDNIEEVAKLIGELKYIDGDPYISVNPRIVPNVKTVRPSFWLTKMGKKGNIRCYSARVFSEQFMESDPEVQAWIDYIRAKEMKSSVPAITDDVIGDVARAAQEMKDKPFTNGEPEPVFLGVFDEVGRNLGEGLTAEQRETVADLMSEPVEVDVADPGDAYQEDSHGETA